MHTCVRAHSYKCMWHNVQQRPHAFAHMHVASVEHQHELLFFSPPRTKTGHKTNHALLNYFTRSFFKRKVRSIHGNLSTLGRLFSLPLIRSPPLHPGTNAIVYFLLLRLLHSLALTFTLLNWSETALIWGEECSVPLTEQQECRKNN